MGQLTITHRVEAIEEKLVGVEESVKNMVSKACDAMRHSLTEVLMEGQWWR